ncbi:MAG: hypothetical protein LBQ66_15030 [Planctomycetaceae bacterium]|jgi:hypothetical protein|nr:hypothetical protein [Planctomycetaceae bacterium]
MKIFERFVCVCLFNVILAMCLFFAVVDIYAAQNDNLRLEVLASKPAALPNIGVVSELITFNFDVRLRNTTTDQIELTPKNVKEFIYVFSCPDGIIDSVPRAATATLSADKQTANIKSKLLLQNLYLSAARKSKGKLTTTLNVKMIFNDNSSLSNSFAITVDIVDAAITVYAKQPDRVLIIKNGKDENLTCFLLDDPANPNHDAVGHSFWRCRINPQNTAFTIADINVASNNYGFSPIESIAGIRVLMTVRGRLLFDNNHPYSASKTYALTVEQAKKIIQNTRNLYNSRDLKYNILSEKGGENCTRTSVKICNEVTGGNSPQGEGKFSVIIDGKNYTYPKPVPNPYHHTTQIIESYQH